MEEAISDYILEGRGDNRVLNTLIEITVVELTTDRPLFPNPLDEPVLYRRNFRRWIRESLEAKAKIDEVIERTIQP